MPFDPFIFFRNFLGWVVTIYATIITLRSAWDWWVYLAGSDKYTTLLRQYLILQALRLRIRTFGGDLLVCALLLVAFIMLWRAQYVMDRIVETTWQARQQQMHIPNMKLRPQIDERPSSPRS